jgi:hypothetical protein
MYTDVCILLPSWHRRATHVNVLYASRFVDFNVYYALNIYQTFGLANKPRCVHNVVTYKNLCVFDTAADICN